jgi:phospholipid/cholesterol/gamma-HCH transport system substrate-binding protein
MMGRQSLELKVGATVIVALAILIIGVLWGKNYRLATGQQPVRFVFENSGGLKPGDPVTVSGVRKGQVSGIGLERGRALITVMLDRDIELFTDVRAYITAVELMGGKKVEIIPGVSGERLNLAMLSEPITGARSVGLQEMLLIAGDLAERTVHIVNRLDSTMTLVNALLDKDRLHEPLHRSADDLRVTTNTLRRLLENNEVLLQRVATNVDYSTTELRDVVARRREGVDSAIVALAEASERLNEFSKTLEDISNRMRQKEGALGRLIYDDQLITNLERAVLRVDSTAVDLRQHLGRYLSGANVNLFNLLHF